MTGNNKLVSAARQMSGRGRSDLPEKHNHTFLWIYSLCHSHMWDANRGDVCVCPVASQSASISSITPVSFRTSSYFSSLDVLPFYHSLFSLT